MAFLCQRDSYAREVRPAGRETCCSERVRRCGARGRRAGSRPVRCGLGSGLTFASVSTQFTTTVVSCRPAELHTEGSNGKKEVLSGFQVVLEDTLLFPEGGGQVPGPSRSPPLPSQEALNFFLTRWEVSLVSQS